MQSLFYFVANLINPMRSVPAGLLLTLGLLLGLLAPTLFAEGMFLDGNIYAVLARNMAEGIGTYWLPSFSETYQATFFGHPTLGFFMESIFFRVFGDYLWVERSYSLVITGLNIYFIALIWRANGQARTFIWLPILLWVVMNEVIWCISNNLLENTLSLFLLMTYWSYMQYVQKGAWMYFLLSCICSIGAVMVKGPVGLLVLAIPTVYFLSRKISWLSWLSHSGLIGLSLVLYIGLNYWFVPDAQVFFESYIDLQLYKGAIGAETVSSRFFIIGAFFKGILIPMLFCILVLGLNHFHFKDKTPLLKRTDWSWFIFVVLGVLPIMITLKQRGFYIIPVYPFMAIFMAIPLTQTMALMAFNRWLEGFWVKRVATGFFLLTFLMNIYFVGKVNRQAPLISDVKLVETIVQEDRIIQISDALKRDWGIKAYFQRYARISLDIEASVINRKHLLADKQENIDLAKWKIVPLELNNFVLYEKK